jgi:hypothetical protein
LALSATHFGPSISRGAGLLGVYAIAYLRRAPVLADADP